MATKKWLSIVVDGNSAMTPSWPKIVSEYLAKIVRAFFDNSRRQVAIPSCEFGLIMYNANNSCLGYNVQFIKWTTNVDHFLGTLSRLTFNGNNENQHTIVQGLAEALVMFTRNMPVQEYFKGERHCILVATGDPVPQKMLVTLPTVEEGKFVVENFKILNAHFLEVAKMFKSLEVSLSVITPNQHPMFRSIFNVGNALAENTQVINYGNDQFTVLLSRNFKEAYNALHNKGVMDSLSNKSVESTKATTFISLASIFNNGALLPASSMPIEEKTMEAVQNEFASTLPPVNPQATTYVPSTSCFSLQMNLADDFLAGIDNNTDDVFNPRKKNKTSEATLRWDTSKDLYQPEQRIPLEDILRQGQTQELRGIAAQSVTNDTTSTMGLTPNSSENVNISIPAGVLLFNASTSIAGEGSSNGPTHEPVLNLIPSSENCSNSSFSFPQYNPNLWPVEPNSWSHPSGINNTTVGLTTVDPPQLGASFGNSTGGMSSTTLGLGTADPSQVGVLFGNSTIDVNSTTVGLTTIDPPQDSFGNSTSGTNNTIVGLATVEPLQLGALFGNSTSGLNNTSVGLTTIDPYQLGALFGNSTSVMNSTTIGLTTTDALQLGASFGNLTTDINSTMVGLTTTEPLQLGVSFGISTSGMSSTTFGLATVDPLQLGDSFDNFKSRMNNTTLGLSTIAPLELGASFGSTNGMNSTTIGLGTINPPQLGASFGNFTNGMNSTIGGLGSIGPTQLDASFGNPMFPSTTGNSLSQFESSSSSPSFPVLPSGSSEQQLPTNHHYNMTGLSPQGTPANTTVSLQPNHTHFRPRPPSLADKGNFEKAWEGCLVGKFDSKSIIIVQAKALRKPTSVNIVTGNWPSRLNISIFIPKKAVNHTMGIIGGPTDYMFFEVSQFSNDELFNHLKIKNLIAKIDLPSNTLILSTTECKYHYLGSLFPAGTIFVEPVVDEFGYQESNQP